MPWQLDKTWDGGRPPRNHRLYSHSSPTFSPSIPTRLCVWVYPHMVSCNEDVGASVSRSGHETPFTAVLVLLEGIRKFETPYVCSPEMVLADPEGVARDLAAFDLAIEDAQAQEALWGEWPEEPDPREGKLCDRCGKRPADFGPVCDECAREESEWAGLQDPEECDERD